MRKPPTRSPTKALATKARSQSARLLGHETLPVAAAYASHGGDVCQANLVAAHRQVGIYVGRILKGAGAADHAMRRTASSVGEVVPLGEALCRFRTANRTRSPRHLPSRIRARKPRNSCKPLRGHRAYLPAAAGLVRQIRRRRKGDSNPRSLWRSKRCWGTP